jgi:hypothetical protein
MAKKKRRRRRRRSSKCGVRATIERMADRVLRREAVRRDGR